MAEFTLPEVGEGIEGGTVVALLVAEGERVEVDQPILELETDKAVVEVPSTVSGVVTKVHVQANAEAKVGQPVLTVDEAAAADGDDAAADAGDDAGADGDEGDEGGSAERSREEAEPDTKAAASPRSDAAAEDADGDVGEAERRPERPDRPTPPAAGGPLGPRTLVPAAPSVRRLAREQGLDIAQVAGSGILGRISADDVMRAAEGASAPAAAAAGAAPPQPLPDFSKWGETERAPMSGVRKATLRAMATAWSTVPMVTHFDRADATEFEALRQRHKAAVEAAGAKLTPTAMLIKVVAAALRKFPEFNASIDVEREEIVYKRYVNVGVAVDTERGLLVPVIKAADTKNVTELSQELGELAERARERKLGPDDMAGGNFSVSNLGGIGGTGFTPIVNPPDVAILGVSRGAMEPVWDEESGAFVARLMMPFALTYDHRLIDGATAARFLRWVCRAVEEPFLLSLEG